MSEHGPKVQAAQSNLRGTEIAHNINRTSGGDYIVGKNRPPLHSRFKPGQSGNPRGRPKGRRNVKTELKELVCKKVKVRDGNKERHVSLAGANLLAHGVKGAQGDVRSAGLFLTNANRMGLLDPELDSGPPDRRDAQQIGCVGPDPENGPPPSEVLFEGLDLNLLARDEVSDLSRLAELVDLGGDITALSTADFERLKHILNRGRGNDVSPR